MDEFLSVILVPTLRCNCACDHCFETLTGEEMTPSDFEVYLAKIREYTAKRGVKYLVFNWQGGEIFCMPPSRVSAFLELVRATFDGDEISVHHLLQTNLLGYTDEWGALIRTHFSGGLGTSLDFPNQYRRTASISKEEYAAAWLEKKRQAEADGLTVSIISVPNPGTLGAGGEAFYRYYKESVDARAVQLNLPFPGAGSRANVGLDTQPLEDFIKTLHDRWAEEPSAMPISPFAIFRSRITKGRGRIPCIFSKNCAENFFCLSPSGEVGQCDAWVAGFWAHNFGNLKTASVEEILSSKNREALLNRPFHLLAHTACGECEFWKLCYGGCPVRAFAFTGDVNTPDHYCAAYKTIFNRLLADFGARIFELAETHESPNATGYNPAP